jgi:sugar lactone lactonase YvrE
MMPVNLDVVAAGLAFPEAPRWHDGALWLSDMYAGAVLRLPPGGQPETVVAVPGHPSGLGFLPDGRLLVVSMQDRKVLRLDAGGLRQHADLSTVATWHANDMLVDPAGRAYVGNFGDASAPPDPPAPVPLALVQPDGTVSVASPALEFPNGMTLINGDRTLVVAETRAVPPRLTAFDVAADGTLGERRVLAEFEAEMPDGICADAADHIWVASPFTGEVLRVAPDGVVVTRIAVPVPPYACALGGADGRTLFICAAATWMPDEALAERTGQVLAVPASVPARRAA